MLFKRAKLFLFMSSCMALNGCLAEVDTVSLAVSENNRIDADIVIGKQGKSSDNDGLSTTRTPEEESRFREDQENINERIKNCVSGSVSSSDSGLPIKISVKNKTALQLERDMECLNLESHANLNLEKIEGFFQDSQILELELFFPKIDHSAEFSIPENFIIEMSGPSNLEVIKDSSAVRVVPEKLNESTFDIRFVVDDLAVKDLIDSQKIRGNIKQNEGCPSDKVPCATVLLKIESKKNKFGISDVLAFFSILFGSGIAITVGSRILAVRTEARNR